MHANAEMPRKGALYTPWHGIHGNVHDADGYGTLIDWTQKQLRSGLLQRISFVHKPEALPAATHERVTLNELLQAVHRQVDANSDGVITHDEMRAFMDAHGLDHLAPCLADLGSPDDLAYADFKELLLGTHVLHVDAEAAARGDESQYAISSSSTLVGLVADVLFDEADVDGDGAVSLEELEALFARRGIRDAARAAAAFERSDANRDSQIDRGEFLELLLGEGLVNEAPARFHYRCKPAALHVAGAQLLSVPGYARRRRPSQSRRAAPRFHGFASARARTVRLWALRPLSARPCARARWRRPASVRGIRPHTRPPARAALARRRSAAAVRRHRAHRGRRPRWRNLALCFAFVDEDDEPARAPPPAAPPRAAAFSSWASDDEDDEPAPPPPPLAKRPQKERRVSQRV